MFRISITLIITLVIAGIGSSCVPKKKLEYANYQRDSLQLAYDSQALKLSYTEDSRDSLQALKDDLAKEVIKLTKERDELQEKYDQLSQSSLDQAARYDKVLELKTKELERKSKALKDREAKLRELQGLIAEREAAQQKVLNTLRGVLSGFEKDELSVNIRDGKIYVSMSNKLLFKSGSAEVDKKGKEALDKIAGALAKDSTLFIVVEGHTDTDPISTERFEDNWDLSVLRSTAVVRILSDGHDIDPKRLTPSGHGEYYPIVPNDSRKNKALNRRTELVISPKLDELYQLLKE